MTLLQRIATRLAAHRRALLVAVLASQLLSLAGLTRFEVRQDVAHLLQGLSGVRGAQAVQALTRFGAFDVLLVDVSFESREDPTEAAAQFAQRLKAQGAFHRVLFELDVQGLKDAYEVLFDRRMFLVPPNENLAGALQAAQRDLMTPLALMTEGAVARDPLNARSTLIERLTALAPQLRLNTDTGRLMSVDGQHALLVLEPKARAFDIEAAEALLTMIEHEAPPQARVRVFGPHVFSTAAARGIRTDVHYTLLSSLIAVGLLFIVILRRVLDVWWATLPVGIGALWALATVAVTQGGLHGITLGFGAVMLGIGIDYGVHLVVHFRDRRARHAAEPVERSMQATLRHVGPSVAMGAATTVVAFAVLLLSGTRALSDMVLFCGLGLVGAFSFACVVLPQWLVRDPGSGRSGAAPGSAPQLRARPIALAVFAAATLGAVFGIRAVAFDGDVRKLDYQPPEVRAVEAEFFERYAPPVHPTLVVVEGPSQQVVLRRMERATELLEQGRERGLLQSFSAPSALVTSVQRQRAHLEGYRPGLKAQVHLQAQAQGLRPEFFAPFFDDLESARRGEVQPLTPTMLASTPFAALLDRSLVRTEQGWAGAIMVHTDEAGQPARVLAPQLTDNLRIMGATVVSGAELAASALVGIKDALVRLSGLSLLAVSWLLLWYYRRPARALLALLPAAVGLLWVAGVLGHLGLPINIVSVGAFALVSGVAVDYGIFVTDALVSPEGESWPATLRSVRLAAGTTLLGFGSLLIADSPVMWSLGFAVCVGVLASVITSIWVLPALYALGLGRDERARAGWALLGLGALCALSASLAAAWLSGARTTNGAEVVVTLLVNVACAVWLLRQVHPGERSHG